jgi:hypothetical protein
VDHGERSVSKNNTRKSDKASVPAQKNSYKAPSEATREDLGHFLRNQER